MIPKSYKMPSVPKKISRLHTNYIPMPNTKESESRVMQPISIKELIQDNFGFNTTDDETDGECMSENDLSISSSTDSIPAPSLSQSNSGTEVKTSSNFLLICDDLSHEFPNTPVHQLEKGFNEGVEELKGLNSPEKVKDECVLVSEGEEKCASVPGCAFSSPDILSDIHSPAARAELSTRGEKTNDICDEMSYECPKTRIHELEENRENFEDTVNAVTKGTFESSLSKYSPGVSLQNSMSPVTDGTAVILAQREETPRLAENRNVRRNLTHSFRQTTPKKRWLSNAEIDGFVSTESTSIGREDLKIIPTSKTPVNRGCFWVTDCDTLT